jgi:carboxyl-terminal processing protease
MGSYEDEVLKSTDVYGFLSFFVFEHLDEDRKRYREYAKEEFVTDFKVDDILFQQFVDYSLKKKLKMDFYGNQESIKLYLKAAMAEQLFNANVHAQIKGNKDAMLQKVILLDKPVVKQEEAEAIEANN